MMLISASIASFDVLRVAEEIAYIDRYFKEIHIDIEDGVAVDGISFGMKMCKGIISLTSSKTSIHLEVINPLRYLEDVKECHPDIVFIQADVLDDPMKVILDFQKAKIPVGLAIGDRDKRNNYDKILEITDNVLVTTAYHEDTKQIYQQSLEDLALKLMREKNLKVWLDGGVTFEKYQQLKNSGLYAAIMGRAIFQNKEKFSKWYEGQEK